jgi:hypothetical protein
VDAVIKEEVDAVIKEEVDAVPSERYADSFGEEAALSAATKRHAAKSPPTARGDRARGARDATRRHVAAALLNPLL